jgi:hypothetical protein
MSKKFYIRTGRSIEEILVRRKLDQEENSRTYGKTGVVPVGQSHPRGAGGGPHTLSPLQQQQQQMHQSLDQFSSFDNNNRSSNLMSKSFNNSIGGVSTVSSNNQKPLLSSSMSFPTPLPALASMSGAGSQSTGSLIPSSYPYAELSDRVRDKEKLEMLMIVAAEYTKLQSRAQELEDELHRREMALKWKQQKQKRRKQTSGKLIEFVSSGKMNSDNLAALIAMSGKQPNEVHQQMQMLIAGNDGSSIPRQPDAAVAADVDIGETVRKVDIRMLHLQKVFAVQKTTNDRIVRAATRIQASARRYICRGRFINFRKALYDWTVRRTRHVVIVLDKLLKSKSNQVTKMGQLTHNQQSHWLKVVFTKWMTVTRQFLSLRRYVREKAHELEMNKKMQLLKTIFKHFVEVTLGANSIRGVNKQRAKTVEAIKEEISAKLRRRGELGVVPKFEVDKVLYRRVLLKFLEGKRLLVMKRLFARIKLLRTMSIRFAHSAKMWWFRKRAGTCFYAWSDYTYQVRSYRNPRRWLGPRHYEVS